MKYLLDIPDEEYRELKILSAQKKTTVRNIILDQLEELFDEKI